MITLAKKTDSFVDMIYIKNIDTKKQTIETKNHRFREKTDF